METKELAEYLDRLASRGFLDSTPELSAAADRLRELDAAQQWRPIEEAPKDGTVVLVVDPDDGPYPVAASWARDNMGEMCWITEDSGSILCPERWLPLPPAPAESDLGRRYREQMRDNQDEGQNVVILDADEVYAICDELDRLRALEAEVNFWKSRELNLKDNPIPLLAGPFHGERAEYKGPTLRMAHRKGGTPNYDTQSSPTASEREVVEYQYHKFIATDGKEYGAYLYGDLPRHDETMADLARLRQQVGKAKKFVSDVEVVVSRRSEIYNFNEAIEKIADTARILLREIEGEVRGG